MPRAEAVELLGALERAGLTVAIAESLTGGQVCAALVEIPGASKAVRGGVVAYDTELKHLVLGVDAALLAAHGAVHPEVAAQMARGVRNALATSAGPADVGIATTGVAGPEPQDGQPVGRVFVSVATPERDLVRALDLTGDRDEIRASATAAALRLAVQALTGEAGS